MTVFLCQRLHQLARRTRVLVLVALMLGVFAPQAFGSLVHDHDTQQTSKTETCPACTLGHTPVVPGPTTVQLAAPLEVESRNQLPAPPSVSVSRLFSVPYACGPPA